MSEAELERRRRRARDLERRLRQLGVHCPPGTLEPLTQDERVARSPAEAALAPQRIERRNIGEVLRVR